MLPILSRAGEWFLRSGIQTPDGGVARYYRVDLARHQPVSTEITGYAVSALLLFHSLTAEPQYLDRARAAARFLTGVWTASAGPMPFEIAPAEFSYFFDCGIVVRGLLAAARATGETPLLDCARAIGDSMERDFAAPGNQFHPILALPGKQPLERDPLRWSRCPGCYQLKSAMAWWDLHETTGEPHYRAAYDAVLRDSLRTAPSFLPGHPDPHKVVDRLHSYLYYLEGLLPVATQPPYSAALCDGIQRVAYFLRELAPRFERSDVYAQLLRIRLQAAAVEAVPLDRPAAEWEAERLAEFAAQSDDPRIHGGFYFGRSAGEWAPYVNPVSTAFAIQALALWTGSAEPDRPSLI